MTSSCRKDRVHVDQQHQTTKSATESSMGAPSQLLPLHLKRSRHSLLLTLAALLLFFLWLRCRYYSAHSGWSFRQLDVTDHGEVNKNLTLVILSPQLADIEGAYCLDGSPPSYYIRKGASTQRSWIVVLQGGGWCWNVSDCYNRSLSGLGSSYRLPKEASFDGIMSANASVNPEFYDWNMIMINYCDGASFSGNLEKPVMYNSTNMYFRGYRVLNLVMVYLLKKTGLKEAERIILGGLSAGGLAASLHIDFIRSLVPPDIPLHGIIDAGFFLDERNISGYEHYAFHMKKIYNMQNASGSLNKACLAAMSPQDKWKCFFAEYTYPYISTPLFIINSAYDYWQQWFILDLRCHPIECPDKLKYLTRHYTIFIHEINQVYHHPGDGMFISSCYAHTQAVLDKTWSTYAVGGKSTREAFSDWYFARTTPAESRYVDCYTNYDCNPSCKESWTLAFYKNKTDHMKNSTPDF
ncbi:pectin acetylesterase 8-like [Patiria miniata]|uniref:Pectin acetylesterase n=1 Tax=Patiria miniata TaxID=46514 RepID=A0A913ZIR1_PATMI|nr:pectin acetylesterase 8-like [Patiria miniata]XP_038050938.1 pectin acetylesterase 8-like [Patiria miniata]XP_038050946.1 pectin acetylesterase 8-like [Patiria miniata]XP_038050956.1 pectin acetylesterase 8-like [Patiria miniata]XP_038050965.1 pectin acetylesterase 8-like [Patiria miniata]